MSVAFKDLNEGDRVRYYGALTPHDDFNQLSEYHTLIQKNPPIFRSDAGEQREVSLIHFPDGEDTLFIRNVNVPASAPPSPHINNNNQSNNGSAFSNNNNNVSVISNASIIHGNNHGVNQGMNLNNMGENQRRNHRTRNRRSRNRRSRNRRTRNRRRH